MTNPIFESMDQDKLRRMIAIREAYNSKQLTIDEARERVRKEVGEVSPEEFAAAEQLVKDETPDECRDEDTQEIVHIYEGLIKEPRKELPFGHPIDAYRREADRMKELMKQGEELAAKPFDEAAWTALMKDVLKYKVHFHRKQNQLYSALERKGFTRPSTTMWTYDDYVRDEMNKARDLLQLGRTEDFLQAFKTMSEDVLDLIGKEELILYPTSLKLISDAEFEEMKHGDREIGFFLIDMPGDAPKAVTASTNAPAGGDFINDLAALLGKYGMGAKDTDDDDRVLDVAEGKLTLEQINLLFRHLPVDISYVDENELVKFYTDTPHRVFPRSKGVIGREVRNCHPPKSVHIVEEIIEKFRTGEQSRSEFWINKPGLFIYIVYVAVRDANGRFRGVMEMMQNCTHIRELEGSRTLLTWDDEQKSEQEQPAAKPGEAPASPDAITKDTKLKALVTRFPKLIDDLPTINEKFAMLRTPIAKVMLPIATVGMMSERSGMPLDELITKLEALIGTYQMKH